MKKTTFKTDIKTDAKVIYPNTKITMLSYLNVLGDTGNSDDKEQIRNFITRYNPHLILHYDHSEQAFYDKHTEADFKLSTNKGINRAAKPAIQRAAIEYNIMEVVHKYFDKGRYGRIVLVVSDDLLNEVGYIHNAVQNIGSAQIIRSANRKDQ
jgi:hypothetical protein